MQSVTFLVLQIYEQEYHPHQEGVYSERGHFIIDKYAGGAATEFNVFALKPYNNFLKSMELQDKRGNTFSSMMDSMAGFHIFSIYNVPYQSVSKNIQPCLVLVTKHLSANISTDHSRCSV